MGARCNECGFRVRGAGHSDGEHHLRKKRVVRPASANVRSNGKKKWLAAKAEKARRELIAAARAELGE